ncbi:hypothetical protein HUT19_02925 [Streptomyces sp. NA02950]|uniref:hypothetical protein n=1 Tax=Streptomyces sp. NA02950 TaxID=2742137 RepID=UPI001592197A|nr:hypothetical protein [Streptomyces sp. NA02950]QKV90821.1 hypothetical protein HUT19_02925 [Streptomyces sp. NA02950]
MLDARHLLEVTDLDIALSAPAYRKSLRGGPKRVMRNRPAEGKESAMRDGIRKSLTRDSATAILLDVSQSENFAVRLHVDLRRQASAICAAGR